MSVFQEPKYIWQETVLLPSGARMTVLDITRGNKDNWVYRLGNDRNERASYRLMWVDEKHLRSAPFVNPLNQYKPVNHNKARKAYGVRGK